MQIRTIPADKGHNDNLKKATEIVERKNKEVAKLFGVEPDQNLVASFCDSTGYISSKIGSQERSFVGYVDYSDEVLIIHPDAVDGLFTDLWKEMEAITVYSLTKHYVCKNYFPEEDEFRLVHKYISDYVAELVSNKYKESIAKFEFRMYTPGKKLKKDVEVGVVLYMIDSLSGREFLIKNLQSIIDDANMKKTLKTLYNKTLDEMMMPLKEKTIEEDRKIAELEKAKRQQQFNDTSNARRPGNNQGQFVRRDKFKSKDSKEDSKENKPHKRKTNFRADGNYSKNKNNTPRDSQKSEDRKKYEKAKLDPSKI
ncbi:MAG: hypothetical protein VX028_02495 [Nanoarchaeota archaeon]|nr:hypothetical protein [Nanoarchaeota archaeon]